jgi:hypothetical protein
MPAAITTLQIVGPCWHRNHADIPTEDTFLVKGPDPFNGMSGLPLASRGNPLNTSSINPLIKALVELNANVAPEVPRHLANQTTVRFD